MSSLSPKGPYERLEHRITSLTGGETGHKVERRFPGDNRRMRGGLAVTAEGRGLACEDFLPGGLWEIAPLEISEELSHFGPESCPALMQR